LGPVMRSPALCGRAHEQVVVVAAVDRLSRGDGGALALMGTAGVGKSRLARELLSHAERRGATVLAGRAVPGSAPVAYRPLTEALLTWTRQGALPDGATLGPHQRALEHLVAGDSSADTGPLSPVFVGEALLRLAAVLGDGRGAVLLLDDVHWADTETLAVVEYIADQAESARLLLVLTLRSEEGAVARRLAHALSARGSARVLDLAPLDAPATAAMAAGCLGEPVAPHLAALLTERSDGVPLLVEELLSALRAGGALVRSAAGVDVQDGAADVLPRSVTDAVQLRLEALSDDDRLVLQSAAILGRSFAWERLADISRLPQVAVLPGLQAAAELALLDEDPLRPGALRFRHALLRDAVEAATFPPLRAELARRGLHALLADGQVEKLSDDDLHLAVSLAGRCGDGPLGARLAVRAALRSYDRWAFGSAERWLAEARRLAGVGPDLLLEIDVLALRVAASTGRVDVVQRLGRALLVRAGDDDAMREVRLETHLRLAQVAVEDARPDEGDHHLALAAPLLAQTSDPCAATRHELWSAVSALQQGRSDQARARAARAIEMATPLEDQLDLVCCALVQIGRAWLPELVPAREAWEQGLQLATVHGMRLWRGRMLAELAGVLVHELCGDDEIAEARALAHEAGAVELLQRVEVLAAELALLRGDLSEAERRLDAAEAAPGSSVVLAATQDRIAAVRALLAALRGDEPGPPHATARGVSALARDDLETARALAPAAPAPAGRMAPYDALLALVADRPGTWCHGAPGRAAAHAQDARRLARDGDNAGAAAALAQAGAELRDAPWLAATLTRLVAPDVLAAGGGDRVRAELRHAAQTLEQAGLDRSAQACKALLRQSGVPVPRRPAAQAGVPDRLRALGVTARELDVLRLVAQGLTSREVGARLYLSPRTVEKHVERLLVKTGSANRTALAALLTASLPTEQLVPGT
jgi:DNA-binding CsgD family transcriptional regulator